MQNVKNLKEIFCNSTFFIDLSIPLLNQLKLVQGNFAITFKPILIEFLIIIYMTKFYVALVKSFSAFSIAEAPELSPAFPFLHLLCSL